MSETKVIGRIRCSHCGGTMTKVNMCTCGGVAVEHLDVYCAVCDAFIVDFYVSPLEVKKMEVHQVEEADKDTESNSA